MKIITDSESLVSGVKFVSKSFDNGNDKAFIALVVKDGEGYLFHENAVSLLKAPVKISSVSFGKNEPEDEVKLALNGVFLQKLASVLTGVKGEVSFSKDLGKANSPLKVIAPTGRFTIPVFDSRVPDLKKFDSLGFVDDYRYFDSLARLSKICDTKHASMPLLSSITANFDKEDEKLILMATDRYSMGEVILDFTPVDKEDWLSDNSPIFIPAEFATLVPATKDAGAVNLVREPKSRKFGYAFDDGRVALFSLKNVSQTFEYTNQKTEALKSINTSFLASMSGLKRALNSVSTLAWDENNIFFNIEEGNVSITDEHEQNVVSVPVEGFTVLDETLNEDGLRISFVRDVIQESLSPITSDTVFFGVRSSSAPASLRCVDEDDEPTEDTFVLAVPAVGGRG